MGYHEDLAYVHDSGFGAFARESAPGLLAILRRRGICEGLVVDLGCGSGIWARLLCDAGYSVLGIDLSRAMIRIARKRAPEAGFRVGSFLDARLPKCDAVTSLGECFNYLFDRRNGISALRSLFRRIHAALKPGGVLIFDIAEPGRGSVGPCQKHVEGNGWMVLVDVEEDTSRCRLTRRITTFRRSGRLYRRHGEVHRLQLYRATDMAAELRCAGFRAHIVRAYGRNRFPKFHAGLIARKPRSHALKIQGAFQ